MEVLDFSRTQNKAPSLLYIPSQHHTSTTRKTSAIQPILNQRKKRGQLALVFSFVWNAGKNHRHYGPARCKSPCPRPTSLTLVDISGRSLLCDGMGMPTQTRLGQGFLEMRKRVGHEIQALAEGSHRRYLDRFFLFLNYSIE